MSTPSSDGQKTGESQHRRKVAELTLEQMSDTYSGRTRYRTLSYQKLHGRKYAFARRASHARQLSLLPHSRYSSRIAERAGNGIVSHAVSALIIHALTVLQQAWVSAHPTHGPDWYTYTTFISIAEADTIVERPSVIPLLDASVLLFLRDALEVLLTLHEVLLAAVCDHDAAEPCIAEDAVCHACRVGACLVVQAWTHRVGALWHWSRS